MLTTLVLEFLKNVFTLLESSNGTDVANRDEKVIEYIFGFVAKIFKNAESSISRLRLSANFKKSMLEDLLSINEDLLKTVGCLEPTMKTTVENLRLRMKFSNVSMSSSVFSEDNVSTLINLEEPVVIDAIKYFFRPESDMRYLYPIQDASISTSVSFGSALTPNLYTAEELKAELQDYKVHCLTVKKCNLSNAINLMTVKDTLNIAVLEFGKLVLVEGEFAIHKMLWHSVIKEHNAYQCLVCSVEIPNRNNLSSHILTPLHLSQLSSNKIWIPSSEMCANLFNYKTNKMIQCCICSERMEVLSMDNHLKSVKHLQNNKANDIGRTILSKLKLNSKTLKESMISKDFADTFKNLLEQHEIDVNEDKKEITCGICATSIPSNIENLYTHISGSRHRKKYDNSLRSKFEKKEKVVSFSNTPGKNYKGFIHMYEHNNMSYCNICNVLIDGSSLDEVNEHIMGHSHNLLLTLYLTNYKSPPLKNLYTNNDANRDLEPYNPANDKIRQTVNPHISIGKENKPICQPKVVIETSSEVFLDCDIVIDKCSWNVMKLEHFMYYCGPCCLNVEVKNFKKHISSDLHIENLKHWYIMEAYPTIKKGNKCNSIFCMSCKDFFKESAWLLHVFSEDHIKQSERHNVDLKELKKVLGKISRVV